MDRDKLPELHYITPVGNLPSIFKSGLLSNTGVKKLKHASVALEEVQEKRSKVVVPNGLRLHEYANLYLHARNPMLYKRRPMHDQLTVLRIRPEVLDLPGAVLADGNAASRYTAFYPSPGGLAFIDEVKLFAESWTSANQIEQWELARVKSAELLVPTRVTPEYIFGGYVSREETISMVSETKASLDWQVNPWFFFLA